MAVSTATAGRLLSSGGLRQGAAEKNALQILESELRKKRRKGVVGIGAMSDTYNPFERAEYHAWRA